MFYKFDCYLCHFSIYANCNSTRILYYYYFLEKRSVKKMITHYLLQMRIQNLLNVKSNYDQVGSRNPQSIRSHQRPYFQSLILIFHKYSKQVEQSHCMDTKHYGAFIRPVLRERACTYNP